MGEVATEAVEAEALGSGVLVGWLAADTLLGGVEASPPISEAAAGAAERVGVFSGAAGTGA